MGSYRRPGRRKNEEDRPETSPSQWQAPRRRIFFGSSIAVVIVAIVVAVVLAITLSKKILRKKLIKCLLFIIVQKTGQPTTSYYSGSVYVNAKFDQLLSDPSSPLAKSYEKDLCTLVSVIIKSSFLNKRYLYTTYSLIDFLLLDFP